MRISSPVSIAASLMAMYSIGLGVVPNSNHIQRKSSLTKILMHVDVICAFSWMRRYATLRYVFTIRVCFEGYLMCMAVIMWGILRRHKPYKHVYRVSLSFRLFIDSPEGIGKDQSWVTHILV